MNLTPVADPHPQPTVTAARTAVVEMPLEERFQLLGLIADGLDNLNRAVHDLRGRILRLELREEGADLPSGPEGTD